jgi:hypothetical protein
VSNIGWKGNNMGLAWFLKDISSHRAYFKFLPRKHSEIPLSPHLSKIGKLEKIVLNDTSGESSAELFELFSLREMKKDWALSQLPIHVNKSITGKYLDTPSSDLLLPPKMIELLEEIHSIRSLLLKQMEGK